MDSEQKGFTLLEVLIALTITALALGVVFGLLGESKRLAGRAGKQLEEVAPLRATLNSVYLQEDFRQQPTVELLIPPVIRDTGELLPGSGEWTIPAIRKRPTQFVLEADGITISGIHLISISGELP